MMARILHRSGPLLLALGFLLWASAFTALYAVLSLGCAWNWDRIAWGPLDPLRSILLLVWAGHMGALVWLVRAGRKPNLARSSGSPATARFIRAASLAATGAALAATAWIGLAIPFVSLCV